MVPGRRLLISEFSLLGYVTGDVKHITAGGNKIWRDKHKGIIDRCLVVRLEQDYSWRSGIGHELYGWDIVSSVRWLLESLHPD